METSSMSYVGKAVFIFDYSEAMLKPWVNAGWECWCFDSQHPWGISKEEKIGKGKIVRVGIWFIPYENNVDRVLELVDGFDFLFGFPECTNLATSGAKHFKNKFLLDPQFQDKAMELVYFIRDLGDKVGCPWALENPVSVISSYWRKPNFYFSPHEYGGYLPKNDVHPLYPEYINPRDAYPKKTGIWYGGGFKAPLRRTVKISPGYSKQFYKLGGRSLKTKNIRSATPRGFAEAVFRFNS